MGTIQERKRQDGTTAYMAKIRLKRDGKIIHAETQTFDRKLIAQGWMKRREAELAQPGAIEAAKQGMIAAPTFADAIDRYKAANTGMGRSKAQCLRTMRALPIAEMRCSEIRAQHWTEMAQSIKALPQTRAGYLSHVAAIAVVAKPLWGIELDPAEVKTATVAMRRVGMIGKSARRSRRPTVEELTRIVEHFVERRARIPWSSPMAHVVAFAMFSARRQSEVMRLRWDDLDVEHSRVLVRDMKNPGGSKGNDVWCDLTPEALRIALAMPRTDPRIFPFGLYGVTMSFVRAAQFLTIDDLHFHDLRHEGVSRLFEMGWSIPQVSQVSGHRSWASLQRYSHIRQSGDKWSDWPVLDLLAPLTPPG